MPDVERTYPDTIADANSLMEAALTDWHREPTSYEKCQAVGRLFTPARRLNSDIVVVIDKNVFEFVHDADALMAIGHNDVPGFTLVIPAPDHEPPKNQRIAIHSDLQTLHITNADDGIICTLMACQVKSITFHTED